LKDAKQLVASPAGIEFKKYPLKFVAPAYFGAGPQPGIPVMVKSGAASLLRLNGQAFALTCWHVLDCYRQRLAEGPRIFQLGDCELDPLTKLQAEDKGLWGRGSYLTDVLQTLPMQRASRVGELLPHRWRAGGNGTGWPDATFNLRPRYAAGQHCQRVAKTNHLVNAGTEKIVCYGHHQWPKTLRKRYLDARLPGVLAYRI
jgi:hypothetical protein